MLPYELDTDVTKLLANLLPNHRYIINVFLPIVMCNVFSNYFTIKIFFRLCELGIEFP